MKSIKKIKSFVYSKKYDDLSDYAIGMRDLINYLENLEKTNQDDLLYKLKRLQKINKK